MRSAQEAAGSDMAVLRNTVVNLLDAMVKQGLISKESAEKLVADAQTQGERRGCGAGVRGAPRLPATCA